MFYLKYRPQSWEELDNKQIRESLGKTVLNNNFSHAYLLLGSRGTGKTTTARLIAKTVNCQKRKKREEPCNKCDSCKAITAGNFLDVIEIDAASNTGVDDIRDLRDKIRLSPAISPYKIYIIDEVHMLSTSAFNALLKILEEPPSHVIFILATTDPQKLPETITSRCLIYDFGKATDSEIKEKLQKIIKEEKIVVTDQTLDILIERAKGSHRDAQKLLEQFAASGANLALGRPGGLNLVNFLLKKEKEKALQEISRLVEADEKIKDLIEEMIKQLRDILLSGNEDKEDAKNLIIKLIEANSLMRDCPLPQLPLELVVVEWCGESQNTQKTQQIRKSDQSENLELRNSESSEFSERWPEIVAATKEHNHSLQAFFRAAKPKSLKDNILIIEVAYKFHKEKLEELKNREVLEKIISDIMKKEIKIKFELKS
ncbi:DNA polymerase III subunit gamma/tau [Candidatus Gottesmanbacteria bacterium]|nr:DNA polymerase III subunit gamma/tau [Candidatus Gottesmanbacteria bacterium]